MEDYMGVPGLTYEDAAKMISDAAILQEQPDVKYFNNPYNNSPYGTFINKPSSTPLGPIKESYLAVAPVQESTSSVTAKSPVKIATPQYVNFNEEELNPSGIDLIKMLFFEQINGQELLLLTNKNFINSQNISYQPIVNASNFKTTYDPKKVLALQDTSDSYFLNFSIKLDNKIPKTVSSESTNNTNVYIKSNGDLVIELVNLENDERVEIQTLLGGTIYKDLIEE